jgi:hypothetical protein
VKYPNNFKVFLKKKKKSADVLAAPPITYHEYGHYFDRKK